MNQEKLERKRELNKIVACKICGAEMRNIELKNHENKIHKLNKYYDLKGKPFVISNVERACSCCKEIKVGLALYIGQSTYLCKTCKSLVNRTTPEVKYDAMNIAVSVPFESSRRKH